jgi:quercetin 2,3-dioxygenase
MAQTILHKASERFDIRSDRGQSYFSFSFGDRYREDRLGFGALRVINDDIIFPGQGFGSHPHDNMEIISIVQEGELTHRDSLGSEGVADPHRLQIISAGSGIFHSEYNNHASKNCRILQIWVYPNTMNEKPRYQQADYIYPPAPDQWQLLIGPLAQGAAETPAAPTAKDIGYIRQDAWFSLGHLRKNTNLPYRYKKPGNGLYIFVIEGTLSVDGQDLERRDGLGVSGNTEITIGATSDAEVLLIEVPMIDYR